jgi:L-asparaginase
MSLVLANSVAEQGARITAAQLGQGRTALDAIEAGIRQIEADPDIHCVGLGSWPNLLGQLELDASLMNGRTLEVGAVGALQGFLHPISVARKIMDELPHVFLVAEGAARFADEWGMERAENVTPLVREAWEGWLQEHLSLEQRAQWPAVALTPLTRQTVDPLRVQGTTVFLAQDGAGDLACGVSTSGWSWKHPGRLGDSPVIGAGNYADNRYGAAGCIGHGELTIRAATARSIVLYIKMGLDVRQAVYEAAADLRQLHKTYCGSVTLYAIDAQGDHFVLALGPDAEDHYWLWHDGMPLPERGEPERGGPLS